MFKSLAGLFYANTAFLCVLIKEVAILFNLFNNLFRALLMSSFRPL
ncbi:hypothetical protein P20429_3318 [Pseudoalteromonas sp. BSi20429]|nr:hypothetical protein P20429_3318 [Pseudoalteromonas sp. BSi20429]